MMMLLLWYCDEKVVCFKKGKRKNRVDEEDISSLPNQPARNACGLDGQHQLEMPSHIKEPKYKCYA